MDPVTLFTIGVAGYWIFKSLSNTSAQTKSTTTHPPPQSTEHRHPPEQQPDTTDVFNSTLQRSAYTSAEECFRSEYVSYTRLRAYNSCPQRFKLAYLDKLDPSIRNPHTGPGQRFHSFCDSILKSWRGNGLPTFYDAKKWPEHIDDEERYKFLRSQVHPKAKILATEHELRFSARDLHFFGIVDLVLADHDGITHLIDYKTGKSPRAHLEQLEIYCLPLLLDSADVTVRLSFILVDSEECLTWEVGPHNREKVIARLFRMIDHILKDRSFPPRVSAQCRDCSYFRSCEYGILGKTISSPERPRLTPAKSGITRRIAAPDSCLSKADTSGRARSSSTTYFFVTIARKQYKCDETGQLIEIGQNHFATKNGRRLTAEGFARRYPGTPLPTMSKSERFGSGR